MKRNIFTSLLLFTLALTNHGQILKDEWVVCNNQGCKLLDPYFSEGVTMKWEGSCVSFKAHGFGKLTKYKDGEYESTYEGEFKNDKKEGNGKYTFPNGSIYEGEWKNDVAFGKGKITPAPPRRRCRG